MSVDVPDGGDRPRSKTSAQDRVPVASDAATSVDRSHGVVTLPKERAERAFTIIGEAGRAYSRRVLRHCLIMVAACIAAYCLIASLLHLSGVLQETALFSGLLLLGWATVIWRFDALKGNWEEPRPPSKPDQKNLQHISDRTAVDLPIHPDGMYVGLRPSVSREFAASALVVTGFLLVLASTPTKIGRALFFVYNIGDTLVSARGIAYGMLISTAIGVIAVIYGLVSLKDRYISHVKPGPEEGSGFVCLIGGAVFLLLLGWWAYYLRNDSDFTGPFLTIWHWF